MKFAHLLAATVAGVALSSAASAANLVVNGDFESGNVGFTSDYTYVAGANSATPPAVYAVDDSPADVHNLWSDFGDHTSGSGQMMIINGSLNSGDWVWAQEGVSVLANTTYFFSTWIASSYPSSPALLDFSINGANVGPTFTANDPPGVWRQFFTAWNSGSSTTADIRLVNRNTAFGGNDFALDDIMFDTRLVGAIPEPTTWALMILGLAGVGAALRSRREGAVAA